MRTARKILRIFGLGSLAFFLIYLFFFPVGLAIRHPIREGESFRFDFSERDSNQIHIRKIADNAQITIFLGERKIELPQLEQFSYYHFPQEGNQLIKLNDEQLKLENNLLNGSLYRAHDFLIIHVTQQTLEEYGFQEMTVIAPDETEIHLVILTSETGAESFFKKLFSKKFDPHQKP